MDRNELRRLKPELEAFLHRYLPLFGRLENHEHARQFVQGLLHGGQRRNVENIAEEVQGGVVRTLQKFVAQACWKDAPILKELRQHVVEVLGDPEGILNVDETGFPKKGSKSVGVKRQYSGTLGRVDNCQVGVFMNYCSPKGHTLVDRRLFLPEEWAADRERREEAGVPEGVIFRTKPELAFSMVQEAVIAGMPFQWVGGDSVYGDSPTFVQGVRALGKWYVVDTSSEARVWLKRPRRRKVGRSGPRGGRPFQHPRAITKPIPVSKAIRQIPASAWKRVTVAHGSQGPLAYDYAEMTVWFSEEGLPAAEPERLLVRRSLGQEAELKFHRSNAPAEVPLERLAEVRACRWTIEQDIQGGKGECGLDEYETRGWTGWHHHTVLSLLALWFLVLQRLRLGEKRAADERSRGPRPAAAPARPTTLGRGRNPRLVPVEAPTKSNRQSVSRKTPPRRIASAK